VKLYKSGFPSAHTNPSSIQKEILQNGPLEGAFTVYQDFMAYKSGVYVHTSGSMLGGHAIKIIGWGNDAATNQNYWICANSWGTGWGEEGFFKIAFGQCGIDSGAYAANPR
jgi:cathepsin B